MAPIEDAPPVKLVGLTESFSITGELISIVAICELSFKLPVIFATTSLDTGTVRTMNVVEAFPASILTEGGVVACFALLASVTTTPPVSAGPERVAVPVDSVPPVTAIGTTEMDASTGGAIVKVAVAFASPLFAVIVTTFVEDTAVVLTAKVAALWPAATVTVLGTIAQELLLDNVTGYPPGPATPINVIVPTDGFPPETWGGPRLIDVSVAGVIQRGIVCDLPLRLVVMSAPSWSLTGLVLTVNLPVFCPASIVNVSMTEAALLLLEASTNTPPGPAGPLSVTVPATELPPATEVGSRLMEISWAGDIVNIADFAPLPVVAKIVTSVEPLTGAVMTLNVAVVAPPAIITVPGMVANPLFNVKETSMPPVGAA